MDPRIQQLAHILVNHSTTIKTNDIIQVDFGLEAQELALEIQKLILQKNAIAKLNPIIPGVNYNFFKYASDTILQTVPEYRYAEAEQTAGYISIICPHNTKELSNIDPEKITTRSKATHTLHDTIITRDNWVLTKYPTQSLAQDAEMSLQEFTEFYFNAVLVDYKKIEQQHKKLKQLMDDGKVITVKTDDTDLTISIENRQAVSCHGERNIPDGEVFIAPVETKVDGHITFSFPAIYGGREVDGVTLTFKDGVVTKATATKNEDFLLKTLNTDAGAKRLGEFAIATNYNIKQPTKQILFDEKIGGTIHMALGSAYKKGGGCNESAIHWDMIKDIRQGGQVEIDGVCVLKDGKLLLE